MSKPDVKKLILLNLPYVFAFYFADKIAAVFRLAPGTEFIDKLTNGFAVFGTAFANPLPSFHPVDLLIGLIAGALLKLAVYVKGKNRKKFRQGEEYGSADGASRRTSSRTRTRSSLTTSFDADGVPDHEQPPEAAKICQKQEHPRHRRIRLRQDALFCQAKPDADAQQLCCD